VQDTLYILSHYNNQRLHYYCYFAVIDGDIEKVMDALNEIDANLDISTMCLRSYENLAKDYLGVDTDLCNATHVQLEKEGRQIFWLNITVEYKGIAYYIKKHIL
jgi:hypothetical protein